MRKGNANKARIVAVMGSTGTGKSLWVFRQISASKRLLVWSPKEQIDDYAGRLKARRVNCPEAMRQALIEAGTGVLRLVYVAPVNRKDAEKAFDMFCKLAMAAENCVVIAEELHTVTRPTWAPDGWSNLIMMGRGYGMEVFGVSQRPASVDKDFFSNCTMLHAGRVNYEDDAKVLARSLMIDPSELLNLADFAYIERKPPKPATRGTMKI